MLQEQKGNGAARAVCSHSTASSTDSAGVGIGWADSGSDWPGHSHAINTSLPFGNMPTILKFLHPKLFSHRKKRTTCFYCENQLLHSKSMFYYVKFYVSAKLPDDHLVLQQLFLNKSSGEKEKIHRSMYNGFNPSGCRFENKTYSDLQFDSHYYVCKVTKFFCS